MKKFVNPAQNFLLVDLMKFAVLCYIIAIESFITDFIMLPLQYYHTKVFKSLSWKIRFILLEVDNYLV